MVDFRSWSTKKVRWATMRICTLLISLVDYRPVQVAIADKSHSSRHLPCAVHLECRLTLDCERHGGACLLLWSAVSKCTDRFVQSHYPLTFKMVLRSQTTGMHVRAYFSLTASFKSRPISLAAFPTSSPRSRISSFGRTSSASFIPSVLLALGCCSHAGSVSSEPTTRMNSLRCFSTIINFRRISGLVS
jgi:hypothetical protein